MENRKILHEKIRKALQEMGSEGNVKTEESKINKSKQSNKKELSSLQDKPELLQISKDSIMEIFEVLDAKKSSKRELFEIAEKLEEQGCFLNAKLIRETVSVYEKKKL